MSRSNQEIMSDGVMSVGEGTRIFPDVGACIDCGGCVVACKRTWDVPRDEQRISISTMLEGQEAAEGFATASAAALEAGESPGETSIPMQCYHCENAPCVSVCPTDSLVKTDGEFVDVREDLCVGCQYCLSACPFGAPQFPESDDGAARVFGTGGKMDKCTMCEERQDVGNGPNPLAHHTDRTATTTPTSAETRTDTGEYPSTSGVSPLIGTHRRPRRRRRPSRRR